MSGARSHETPSAFGSRRGPGVYTRESSQAGLTMQQVYTIFEVAPWTLGRLCSVIREVSA